MAKHAPNVPLIVVATQTDVFEGTEYAKKQRMLKREGRPMDPSTHVECDDYAQRQLNDRIQLLEEEMGELLGKEEQTQLVACVGVTQGETFHRLSMSAANLSA
jgi:hypothetical protein